MSIQSASTRILIVRNDRVGDLVLTLPTIEAIRTQLPESRLTLLASRYAGPLVAEHSAINELLYDEPSDGAWTLGRKLAKHRFDAALVLNTNTRNCLAVRVAGIRQRVCWAYKPVGWLTATHPVKLHRSRPPIHEAAFALAFAEKLGISSPPTIPLPHLPNEDAVKRRISDRIAHTLGTNGPLVGIHPGNKNSAYNWPVQSYAELVAHLATRSRVLLTGSPEERPLLDEASSLVDSRHKKNVTQFTDLSLAELAATIALEDVLVVSSTGPMHIAGAIGTPVVALFSPHPAHVPAKWAPLGSNHTLIVAPLADDEDPAVPREKGLELMARIPVSEVLHSVLKHTARPAAA